MPHCTIDHQLLAVTETAALSAAQSPFLEKNIRNCPIVLQFSTLSRCNFSAMYATLNERSRNGRKR
ncbi:MULTISPECIES: hypothetical protein [unclassified Rhizobium]|uniref:hypothetical protein n=1 Tax=unclassified Rhizobium TaxID=2613769 RepID=UPI0013C51E68|nr:MULTISPECIES: hypothetical protein [unclassified Rhizobium]